jgi:hypothetical protein
MKNKQYPSNPVLVLSAILISLVVGCVGRSPRPNYYKSSDQAGAVVDEKYRLSSDREALDKLRTEIPENKKQENDELAFTMQLMSSEYKKTPGDVRDRFNDALRKKREKFQKDLQKERDEFTKKERKDREDFLKSMTNEREDFLKLKRKGDERTEFFEKQDEARKVYFETQRERRDDFESNITEKRKNFEDYAREKSTDFNEEWRLYQKKYDEHQKDLEKNRHQEKGENRLETQKNSDETQSF